jgi:serine/threonine-protein kinase
MGQVWAATHLVTRRAVALKLLKSPSLQPVMRERFLREARAASAVRHPSVVEIRDFFELEDATPVMVMDLLEGETFAERLARERQLPLREAVDVLLPVISAAGAAHACGITHRDLKPDNVFLSRNSEGSLEVRVLDFGIAKLSDTNPEASELAHITDTGTMLGTPCYMSPEQSLGEKSTDYRTDIWAIGVMLYEALSGARPVDGANLGQVLKHLMTQGITPLEILAPDLPEQVTRLVGRMLSRDPAARPADLREVHATLKPFAGIRVPSFGPAVQDSAVADTEQSEAPVPDAAADTQGPYTISAWRTPQRRASLAALSLLLVLAIWSAVRLSSRVDSRRDAHSAKPAAVASAEPTRKDSAPMPATTGEGATRKPAAPRPSTPVIQAAQRAVQTRRMSSRVHGTASSRPSGAPTPSATASAPRAAVTQPKPAGGLINEPPF